MVDECWVEALGRVMRICGEKAISRGYGGGEIGMEYEQRSTLFFTGGIASEQIRDASGRGLVQPT
jgi:hypothetical protein